MGQHALSTHIDTHVQTYSVTHERRISQTHAQLCLSARRVDNTLSKLALRAIEQALKRIQVTALDHSLPELSIPPCM